LRCAAQRTPTYAGGGSPTRRRTTRFVALALERLCEKGAGMSARDIQQLLSAAPWLRKYGRRFLRALTQLGVTSPEEIASVDTEAIRTARGAGGRIVDLLQGAQRELQEREGQASRQPIAPDAGLRSLELVKRRYPRRLVNSLGRAGVKTVGQALAVDPDTFASMRGVGKSQVVALRDLQAELRARMGRGRSAAEQPEPEPAPQATDHVAEPPPAPASGARAPEPEQCQSLGELLRSLIAHASEVEFSDTDAARDASIWLRYHRLEGGERVTLREIGEEFELSAGRVQQIIARISHRARAIIRESAGYGLAMSALRTAFRRCLGVAITRDFRRLLHEEGGWSEAPSAAEVGALVALIRESRRSPRVPKDSDIIRHSYSCKRLWKQAAGCARRLMTDIADTRHFLDFAFDLSAALSEPCSHDRSAQAEIIPCCGAAQGEVSLPPEYVRAVLFSFDPCPLEDDEVIGHWQNVLRRGTVKREVIRAALEVLGEPTHYADLTEFISQHNPWFTPSDRSYVHVCLSGSDDYIRTRARGVYGLREWGVRPYLTAADRVQAYLRQRGHPAPMWEIVRALEAQGVPENNVRASFDQQRFARHADGTVGLSEWTEKGFHRPRTEFTPTSIFVEDSDDGFIMG